MPKRGRGSVTETTAVLLEQSLVCTRTTKTISGWGSRTDYGAWKPGPPKFYPLAGEPERYPGLQLKADDGGLLICTKSGVRRFVDGKIGGVYDSRQPLPEFTARRLLHDRDWRSVDWNFGAGALCMYIRGKSDVFAAGWRPFGR